MYMYMYVYSCTCIYMYIHTCTSSLMRVAMERPTSWYLSLLPVGPSMMNRNLVGMGTLWGGGERYSVYYNIHIIYQYGIYVIALQLYGMNCEITTHRRYV